LSTGDDPVRLGLVTSLSRPGGNVTGVTELTVELTAKRLELVHELVPAARVIGLLANPDPTRMVVMTRDAQAAATNLGLELIVLPASTEAEVESAFASLAQKRVGALVIGADAFLNSIAEKLGELALRHSMPAIFGFHQFAAAGGLASYSGNIMDSYHLASAADLPVEQSTKVELIFNLKSAKALGVTIPVTLLGRADEVIE
jgi:putative tryptophan/tyrosine transport system substrate-binding protein